MYSKFYENLLFDRNDNVIENERKPRVYIDEANNKFKVNFNIVTTTDGK